ncbi:hypothetical protein MPSEU_000598000 [Mayamaea pseudoterrestris]|nr:hypothetical protein MPSEU_000598000 [Mayamaea pseudoterrestris]
MKMETLSNQVVSRVMRVLSLAFLSFVFQRSNSSTTAFTLAPAAPSSTRAATTATTSTVPSKPKEMPVESMTAIIRMRNADRKELKKLPDNALSVLEETMRILYSHRITHQIRFKRAQKPIQNGMADWAVEKIHQEARRRLEQIDQEIAIVKKCMLALQQSKATTTLAPRMQHKIQLLLEVDFKDPNHSLPIMEEVAPVIQSRPVVVPTKVVPTPMRQRRSAFPATQRRLPAFSFA